MELADMQDLGSCARGRKGSSPLFRIKIRIPEGDTDFLCFRDLWD